MTTNGPILSGDVMAVLNVGRCAGFNVTYDAYTGLESPSSFTLEEMPEG